MAEIVDSGRFGMPAQSHGRETAPRRYEQVMIDLVSAEVPLGVRSNQSGRPGALWSPADCGACPVLLVDVEPIDRVCPAD